MKRLRLLGIALPLAALAFLVLSLSAGGAAGSDTQKYRWDLIRLSSGPGGKIVLSPGGTGAAFAEDGSKITVTGSGTFRPSNPGEVTGGGTWTSTGGAGSGSGTYVVTRLVRFDLAPGFVPEGFIDAVTGHRENARSGLAFLQITYSDGREGVLVVSCHLPAGSPATMFEGITASKRYVDYWNREAPFGGPTTPNGNRTQFHIV